MFFLLTGINTASAKLVGKKYTFTPPEIPSQIKTATETFGCDNDPYGKECDHYLFLLELPEDTIFTAELRGRSDALQATEAFGENAYKNESDKLFFLKQDGKIRVYAKYARTDEDEVSSPHIEFDQCELTILSDQPPVSIAPILSLLLK